MPSGWMPDAKHDLLMRDVPAAPEKPHRRRFRVHLPFHRRHHRPTGTGGGAG